MFTQDQVTLEKCEISEESRLLDRRAFAQVLAANAHHLRPADRALIRAFFQDGRTSVELARLARTCPKTILRRIDRLAARVSSPQFAFVVNHSGSLGRIRCRIAIACIVNGLSQRQASRELRLSIHAVRAHMIAINGMFERLTRE